MQAKVRLLSSLLFSALTCFGAEGNWMQQRVEKDLAPFAEHSLTAEMLKKTFDSLPIHADVACITIKDGDVRVDGFKSIGGAKMCEELRILTRLLSKRVRLGKVLPSRRLPECTFLLSVSEDLNAKELREHLNLNEINFPIFARSKVGNGGPIVLFPEFKFLKKKASRCLARDASRHAWKAKRPALFWQGGFNDGPLDVKTWKEHPRTKLVLLAKNRDDIYARFTKTATYTPRVLFAKTCGEIAPLNGKIHLGDALENKYFMAIEGFEAMQAELFHGLAGNSALFLQASERNYWFSDLIQPWEHAVPVAHDLGDLDEKMAWAKANDAKAQAIADAGRKLGSYVFNSETCMEYIQTALSAYKKRLDMNDQRWKK